MSTVTAVNIDSAGRYSPTISSSSGTTRTSRWPLTPASAGNPALLRCRMPRASVAACSAETPGRSRPSALNMSSFQKTVRCPGACCMLVCVNGGMTYGTQNSLSGVGKWKPSASTPTTRCGSPSKSIVVPTMAGSDAKRLVQAPWLSSTTRSAPMRASCSRKSRPRWGTARNSGNSDGETLAPRRVTPPEASHSAEIPS